MGSAILLDGAPDTAADWGGLLVAPSTESVTEMQLTTPTTLSSARPKAVWSIW